MRILVAGAGRGGTTLTREVIKGLNVFDWYPRKGGEDRKFFKHEVLSRSYGTKLAVENEEFIFENLAETMERYNDLHIIFVLRHPVDNCMAKIVRGQKASDGGDSRFEELRIPSFSLLKPLWTIVQICVLRIRMSKAKLHIYGKYMGDIKVIHDVLEESNEYDLTYEYIDTGKGSRPASIDYLIASHNNPEWYGGKVIHTHHGIGCIPILLRRPAFDLLAQYKKAYYALCTYGKVHKSWFEKIGFPSERLLVVGMPVSVELLSPMNMQEREKFLHKKGLDSAKETIIYAPTWDNLEERGFFCLWWQDGREEERIEEFCKFVTGDLNMNLFVRLHERHRYSQDWIKKYHSIFDMYKVSVHYFDQDPYNLPYFKFSDVLVGDLSTANTYFYVMDKPVIHIGAFPFKKKIQSKWGGMALSDRAGYVVEDFEDLLAKVKDSVVYPARFSVERKRTVGKYIDYVGEDSKEAILNEFRRLLC